ncbi:MAG: tetratricopeptide repeat protein [Anaerolineae bacterium]|nr:tetratricopeptide repeat protein [Anaerolineae bacterium]
MSKWNGGHPSTGSTGGAAENRGRAKFLSDNYQGAIADCNEAIHLNPQYTDAYTGRGYAWENLGDYEKALADYEAALRIKPDYELARKNRDDLLKKMKK